ncbi:TPR repeat-containing protein [Campylobacter hyointestinalis subsp. hyointestinalis]|uniref:TPR repeat-containing protein n=1 Tax=Campylobacter hyointestinalis subsp. hyointestinalis TaxID=91352 RepID=A0A9W5ES88_CAMHY|nr:hypothetical protein [Campylobacter hyointestinalis]CUU72020.1 TPR repeat-containing protein [Campylobacter hyointestinalis subsp. hyointestinalis]CUU81865.1 TPR repeat-containing protein [Campylobacter hyointestinalis subsp. hyointestinalis]CUU89445.1 TPR repeat-containing protein [Campylobacter hyointestinalis subsp. hyointestinalis]
MKRNFIFAALFGVASFLSAEVSVFDAGNINQDTPYGLTENEKILLKNKQKVEKLNQNIGSVQSDIANVQENIEGLRTVLDGINANNQKMDSRISDLENRVNANDLNLTSEITELKKSLKQNQDIQEKNYKKITQAISELTSLIDSINNQDTKSAKTDLENSDKAKANSSTVDKLNFDGKKLSEVLEYADLAYKKKDYDNSKSAYLYLVDKNHKPAYSNFMLGEILYIQKAYKEAIPHYQKSVELYDKADYMPKLLYHTAISFDKIGDKNSANKFYHALKQAYPNSKEAKASPNRK